MLNYSIISLKYWLINRQGVNAFKCLEIYQIFEQLYYPYLLTNSDKKSNTVLLCYMLVYMQ